MGKILNKLGLAAVVAGVAAFFLGTKKGQEMTKQAMSKTEELLGDVKARLATAGEVTEEKFKEVSERVIQEWHAAQRLTTEELTEARVQLAGLWNRMKSRGTEMMHGHEGHDAHKTEGHKCEHC